MTDFQLTITIDNAGLQTISEAGMSVALLQFQELAAYQIVALLPAATNTILIRWTDALSVYVSSTSLQAYSVLQINSEVQALSGQVFTFNGSYISQTGSTDLANTIQLGNASSQMVTAGLARAFDVSGQLQSPAITTATSVLINGLGSFEIGNQFVLTLLGGAQVGMAIPNQVLPSSLTMFRKARSSQISAQPPLYLNFTAASPALTVHFNDQNDVFVLVE